MDKKVIISPSILSCDHANIEAEAKKINKSSADWVHIDVMDGQFVPEITYGEPVVRSIRKLTKLPFDVHLMITNPEKYWECPHNACRRTVRPHHADGGKQQHG